jgi:hypothetical protein
MLAVGGASAGPMRHFGEPGSPCWQSPAGLVILGTDWALY